MWWIFFIIITIFFYKYVKKSQNYWKERGVNYIKPTFFFGNNVDNLIQKKTLHQHLKDNYNKFPNARYFGTYDLLEPNLIIRDPELIKDITVRNFDHFSNHEHQYATKYDPFWSRSVFESTDEKWRKRRQFTSQLFTLSRLRAGHKLMLEKTILYLNYFNEKNDQILEFSLKKLFSQYTTDVTASTVFGINCDTLKNPDNEFYKMGKDLTDIFSLRRLFKTTCLTFLPKFSEFLHLSLISKSTTKFWKKVVDEIIEIRKNDYVNRPDVISFMLDARQRGLDIDKDNQQIDEIDKKFENEKKNLIDLNDTEIMGQSVNFFNADFEAAASTMALLAYELAINPDVQMKLYHEIMKIKQKYPDGILDYNALNKIEYLDMAVNEAFRKWSVTITIDRICTKQYTISPKLPDEKPLIIQKGQKIIVPVYGLHMDPNHFTDPERFDPERFDKENDNIVPYTYFPFGVGLRSCLAIKYIYLEIKTFFAELLINYEIVPTKKTDIPLEMNDNFFMIDGKNGVWVGFKARNTKN